MSGDNQDGSPCCLIQECSRSVERCLITNVPERTVRGRHEITQIGTLVGQRIASDGINAHPSAERRSQAPQPRSGAPKAQGNCGESIT